MIIILKNKPSLTANIYGYKYYMKDEIKEAFKKIDTEIKKYNYVTLDIIKKLISKLSSKKLIDVNDIVVYKNKNKNEIYKDTEIIITPDNSIFINLSNFEKYYNKRSATIEYVLPENLELEENVITKLDSTDDNFQSDDQYIHKFFLKKYGLEHNKNCILEGFLYSQNKYVKIDNDEACFLLGTKIRITIKEEIQGVTKKKVEKYKININFEVKDPSKYVFKTAISNISSLEIENGKIYNDLITEINKHLGKNLNKGFKIYKNAKDSSNEFTTGNLEDNTTYIVVFDETATDFIKEKDKTKFYINLNFDVVDGNNFKLKSDNNNITGLEIDKGKNYNDLLNLIKNKLGNKELKEGFKIYKNDKNNEFTTGILEDKITYIVVFDNDDSNFVEEKPKPKPKPQTPEPQTPEPQEQDPPKTQETTNTEQNNNDDNKTTKKGGCSGKNKKKCC